MSRQQTRYPARPSVAKPNPGFTGQHAHNLQRIGRRMIAQAQQSQNNQRPSIGFGRAKPVVPIRHSAMPAVGVPKRSQPGPKQSVYRYPASTRAPQAKKEVTMERGYVTQIQPAQQTTVPRAEPQVEQPEPPQVVEETVAKVESQEVPETKTMTEEEFEPTSLRRQVRFESGLTFAADSSLNAPTPKLIIPEE